MPNMHIVRGIPGSGKSTHAQYLSQRFHDDSGIVCLETDQLFMDSGKYCFNIDNLGINHKKMLNIVSTFISSGADVIISNTFTTLKELKPYLELAGRSKYTVYIHDIFTQYVSTHNVPKEVIEKMKKRFKPFDEILNGHRDNIEKIIDCSSIIYTTQGEKNG